MLLVLLLAQVELTVEASDHARRYAVAEWVVEGDLKPPYVVKENGKVVPCQLEGKSLRWMIVDLPAREKRTYLVETGNDDPPLMAISDDFVVKGPTREITRYQNSSRPHFYPLTAHGVGLTRDPKKGNLADHPHHVSHWFAHGDVNGRDYWAKLAIEPKRLVEARAGPVYAKIVVENAWGDDLVETREVRIYDAGEDLVMDWTITLTAANGPVKLGKTKEGSFAIRVAEGLTEKKGGKMTTSDGRTGEADCRSKPAPWCDFSGTVDGQKVGVAILEHPGSFRAPTDWHVRGYGLLAANVFMAKDGHTLAKGESITFKYRVYGHGAEGRVAEVYAAYSTPVRVSRR